MVHNRVESIHSIASLVSRIVPEARLAVAHGQTTEAALEKVMVEFVAHEYDVLIATTIIENGLDIPNVNTIIINHAENTVWRSFISFEVGSGGLTVGLMLTWSFLPIMLLPLLRGNGFPQFENLVN